jgi:hypothetical protein
MSNHIYNCSEVALLHAKNNNVACLKADDVVYFDFTFENESMTLNLFENFLNGRYNIEYLCGNRNTRNMVHYKILDVK